MKNEEEPVHGGADSLGAQTGGTGHSNARNLPQAGDRRADILPLAKQVCVDAAQRPHTAQVVRGEERKAQEAGGGSEPG